MNRRTMWLPIVLSAVLLAGLATRVLSPEQVKGPPPSKGRDESAPTPASSLTIFHPIELLRKALLSHDLAKIESILRGLIAERGDGIYPELIPLLLDLSPAADTAVLEIVSRFSKPLPATEALLAEVSTSGGSAQPNRTARSVEERR